MRFIDKDILAVPTGIICHQVNMEGVMGAGLALSIKIKWPKIYNHYRREYEANRLYMGRMLLSKVDNRRWVAHLVAQESYGPGVRTNYKAFRSSIQQVRFLQAKQLRDLDIYLPYKIGCGLAGGDWDKVLSIIEAELPGATICVKK